MVKMTRKYNGQKDKIIQWSKGQAIRWLQGQDNTMDKMTGSYNGQKDKTIR